MRQEVRLGGFGGQGIILAGYMLGKAAALYDGKEAVFTQAYGPEARGGACSADLVISDEPIGYPMVSRPDLLVLMSQEAFTKYGSAVAEGAQLIVDTDLAESGAKVILVEKGPSIGGKMAALDKNFPTLDCSFCIEAPKLSEVGEHPNIEILNNAEVDR